MSSPPVIGGSEENNRDDDSRISNEDNEKGLSAPKSRHTLNRKGSASQRGISSPVRSTNDVLSGGLRRRNTKPRRRSDTVVTAPSKRDLTKPMMELQRINKARRFLEDVKRIAENWIYMLKQVEEQESMFTAELMERLDDDDDELSDSESLKTMGSGGFGGERPKSGMHLELYHTSHKINYSRKNTV